MDVQTGKRMIAVGIMDILVAKTADVHYQKFRPMRTMDIAGVRQLLSQLAGAGIRTDCSETVTLIFHLSGFKDPNGRGYDGIGNTDIMAHYLPHFAGPASANPCSILVLNADRDLAEQHVCVVHTADHAHGDPLLFSHGGEADPRFIRWSSIKPGFPGRAVWLSILGL